MTEIIKVGQTEKKTQSRIVKLFQSLEWTYLGDWTDRDDNRNIEPELLCEYLADKYTEKQIKQAVSILQKSAVLAGRNFFEVNRDFYSLLRYGVNVKELGQKDKTVQIINWTEPEKNNFAIAEEVTVHGHVDKRPDVMMYINGIAIGVLELKRSTVSVSEGIRQNIGNQKPEFIQEFFTTMQIILAGNDTEGLRYATTETPEKYWLEWREEILPIMYENKLDNAISNLCNKKRILDIMYDFIIFDKGTKKTCRHNQYFGIKAAQEYISNDKGGIIWHTQGSGKTLTMAWLAKWILENIDGARILALTDRVELDENIRDLFIDVGETNTFHAKSAKQLFEELNKTEKRILCSLVHKFGHISNADGETKYSIEIDDIRKNLPAGFSPKGKIFVFVDECHRSHSGKLHDAMREILGENAVFIGFTGTPLLSIDKKNSAAVWGDYIHQYKYNQAVIDGVVLDLRYEARSVEQDISSQDKIDDWFERKTANLTDVAKAELKKKWGTMQNLMSSKSRMEKIVIDIESDFETKPRLASGRGNAMLVASSIYEACQYYKLFQDRGYLTKCAVVTSYDPNALDTESAEYKIYKEMLNGKSTEDFESEAKRLFKKYPGQMQLLIVVDKLLTGFDAPSATYLYIDKNMQNHGLFQAVCRVNRLDDKDIDEASEESVLNKDYGYVVDYRDLFKKLENAVNDYTSNALAGFDHDDVIGLLKDKNEVGKEDLENALEVVQALCEPVPAPRGSAEYIRYFCGDTENVYSLKENEQKRQKLYKSVSSLVRKYEELAGDMKAVGYNEKSIEKIKTEVEHYKIVSNEIKRASGDWIDLKKYDKDMRNLFDQYILAKDSEVLNNFNNDGLLKLISDEDANANDGFDDAAAEMIENNVRRMISDEHQTNPKYYDKMSTLLTELIKLRHKKNIEYREYLKQIAELAKQVKDPSANNSVPGIDTRGKRALYDALDLDADKAIMVFEAVKSAAQADWRSHPMKRRAVKQVIQNCGVTNVDQILEIVAQNVEF